MLNEPIIATVFVLALLIIGELISIASRARIPMLFVVFFGYLIALWTGIFPNNILEKTPLTAVGGILIAPLIVHMGTLIPLKTLKTQYKSVVVSIIGIIFATILILLVVAPILGYQTAVSGIGPLTGGLIAFVITSEKLQEIGLTSIIVIPALVLAVQSLIGLPLASNFLRKYALKLRDERPSEEVLKETAATVEQAEPAAKSWVSEKYATPIVLLFQLFIGGGLAVLLGNWTGIHYSLWALAIGFIGILTGFFRENMMQRANSFGIATAGLIFVLLPSLNSVTLSIFIKNLPAVLLILLVGAIGIIIGGIVGSKIFKWDKYLGIPVALTALFGFPGDYMICEEISRSIARNKQEEKWIFSQILTPLLIGGFTTVTVASVILASVLMGTL
ncbi:hypothetical protein [Heyndrickxia vini]|uniref:Integral membrane protein n=1 Tax=Heyndrickxia vini TaxID=1476025 RepID=A0ABX7E269_9BACI|nr:hypothetical protein [Heyndrickxia vini]QQZ09813.1 hypothetical protein I5776_02210 [Heyndrickxia vini]